MTPKLQQNLWKHRSLGCSPRISDSMSGVGQEFSFLQVSCDAGAAGRGTHFENHWSNAWWFFHTQASYRKRAIFRWGKGILCLTNHRAYGYVCTFLYLDDFVSAIILFSILVKSHFLKDRKQQTVCLPVPLKGPRIPVPWTRSLGSAWTNCLPNWRELYHVFWFRIFIC